MRKLKEAGEAVWAMKLSDRRCGLIKLLGVQCSYIGRFKALLLCNSKCEHVFVQIGMGDMEGILLQHTLKGDKGVLSVLASSKLPAL